LIFFIFWLSRYASSWKKPYATLFQLLIFSLLPYLAMLTRCFLDQAAMKAISVLKMLQETLGAAQMYVLAPYI
jgi:hypothetical protein